MNAQKIADGAYFVPAYSEQTIAWAPFGYTVQGLTCEESPEETEPLVTEQEVPPTKINKKK